MVRIATSRVDYRGIDKLNITVQSGEGLGDTLAPTWGLVGGYKLHAAQTNGDAAEIEKWGKYKPLSETEYTERYLNLLRSRYAENKQPFLDILSEDRTLMCYCGAGQFCHRHLAVDVLEKIAAHHQIPFERGGELDLRTGQPLDKRQDVELGVLPIVAPNGKTTLGYAAAVVVHQGKGAALLELAHFGPKQEDRAGKYTDQVSQNMQERHLPLYGGDLDKTVGFLTQLSGQNRLRGEWEALTSEQVEGWSGGDLSITHTFNQIRPFTGLDRDYDDIER